MMKHTMFKWIKRFAMAGILVVFAAILVVYLSLNAILRSEIQTQASASLGVPTTLGSASLSLLGGSLALEDLEINSPPGFNAPKIFTLGYITVFVHYGQLTSRPIHIQSITIHQPMLVIEQSGLKLNVQSLMNQSPQTPSSGNNAPSTPIKLIIDQLTLTDAQVNVQGGIPGYLANQQIQIPSITITNIGNADGAQNGAAIKDVVNQVINAIVVKAGLQNTLSTQLNQVLEKNHVPGDVGNLVNQGIQGLMGKKNGQ